jgi:hypothetical protein
MIQSYVGMTNLNKNELPCVSMIESYVSIDDWTKWSTMRKHDRVIRKHDDWTRNEIPCVSMIESYVSMTIGQEMKYHA